MITAELPPDQKKEWDCIKKDSNSVLNDGHMRYDIRLQKVLKDGRKEDINLKMNSLGKYYVRT